MLSDWIEMRTDLGRDHRVLAIAAMIQERAYPVKEEQWIEDPASIATAIGALHLFWSWAQERTTDGFIPLVPVQVVDDVTGVCGFGNALVTVGWLRSNGGKGITIPKFAEHMGQGARARSLNAKRQAVFRAKNAISTVTSGATPALRKRYAAVTKPLPTETGTGTETETREKYTYPPTPLSDNGEVGKPPLAGAGAGRVAQAGAPASPSEITAGDRFLHQPAFALFWQSVPKKHQESVEAARNEFILALHRGATPDVLACRIAEYYTSVQGRGSRPYKVKNWLAQGKYLDPPEAWGTKQRSMHDG